MQNMTFEENIANSIVNYLMDISLEKSKKKRDFYCIPIHIIAQNLSLRSQDFIENKSQLDEMGLKYIEKDKDDINEEEYNKSQFRVQDKKTKNQFCNALEFIEGNVDDRHMDSKDVTKDFKNIDYVLSECDYLVITNVNHFVEKAIKFVGIDKIIDIFDWKNFEAFISEILRNIGFKTTTNFRFSLDKKSKKKISTFTSKTTKKKQIRFEIDVIGIYNNMILVIDAKYWKQSHDNFSALTTASKYQMERARILSEDKNAINKLFSLLKVKGRKVRYNNNLNLKKNSMNSLKNMWIYPIIIQSGLSDRKISHYGVPIVSLREVSDFFQNFKSFSSSFVRYKIKELEIQTELI